MNWPLKSRAGDLWLFTGPELQADWNLKIWRDIMHYSQLLQAELMTSLF